MDSSLQIIIMLSPFTSSLCITTTKLMHIKGPPLGVNFFFQIIKKLNLNKLNKNHIFESFFIKFKKTFNLGHIIIHKGFTKMLVHFSLHIP
jgi:hypothetical protein